MGESHAGCMDDFIHDLYLKDTVKNSEPCLFQTDELAIIFTSFLLVTDIFPPHVDFTVQFLCSINNKSLYLGLKSLF